MSPLEERAPERFRADDSRGTPRRSRAVSQLPKPTLTAATAVVALAAALLGLLFDLWPSLKPDPRTQLAANLAVIAVERNVTEGAWLRRTSASDRDYVRRRSERLSGGESPEGLRIAGELAYVRVAVRGFKRRGIVLNWAIYDARTQSRTDQESREQQGQRTLVSLDAPTDEFVAELWLPPVFGPGRYFVRIEAREPTGTLLAIADSHAFRGL